MNGRKSTPEIGSSEVERPLVPFDIDTEPVRSPVKRIRPVDARGGIWSARKIRAAHGEREGGGGGGSRRLRPWKEVVAIHGRKEAQILGLALPYTGQRSDSRYAKRVCPRVRLLPFSFSTSVHLLHEQPWIRHHRLPCPPSPPRGGDRFPLDAPRTTLRYTFLSTYVVVSSPTASSRVQGLPFRAMGNPLRPGKQRGERANPSSPPPPLSFPSSSPPRNYSEIVFSLPRLSKEV